MLLAFHELILILLDLGFHRLLGLAHLLEQLDEVLLLHSLLLDFGLCIFGQVPGVLHQLLELCLVLLEELLRFLELLLFHGDVLLQSLILFLLGID